MNFFVKSTLVMAGLAFGSGQACAQAAKICLTPPEVSAVALSLLPAILESVGEKCASALPATALIRNPDSPFFARYREAAEASRADAVKAFAKLGGGDLPPELDGDAFGQLMVTMIGPMMVKEIGTPDCAPINQMVELLEPLPPQNMAGALALVLQLVKRDKDKKSGGKNDDLPICPMAGAR